MAEVTLSSGIRDALLTIQRTTQQASEAQVRLATGKKVNTAIDNPLNYFTAAGLNDRANDLALLQDAMGQASKTIEAASSGIDGITKLLQTAQGLANSAAASSDASTRAALQAQVATLFAQADELMKNSGYNGINLLNGNTLTVKFDTSATTSTLGVRTAAAANGTGALTSTNLGLNPASGGTLVWTNGASDTIGDAAIQRMLTSLSAAIGVLRAEASGLGANQAIVKTRQDFTMSMINHLKTGADNLILADTNEEGAKLISLNTRGQLAQTSLSLAAQREQGVLRLFS
ncbi:MAG: flagellin [Burkholderiales bacterium]|nr:flagellin [Burkholderiales bacterium]